MDSTETLYQKARSLTDVYGQSGLLAFYDALDEGGRQRLLQEILRVDFPLMKNLYEHVALASGEKEKMEITPMPCTDAAALPQKERAALYAEGLEAIRRGELAALTMAARGRVWGMTDRRGPMISVCRPISLCLRSNVTD